MLVKVRGVRRLLRYVRCVQSVIELRMTLKKRPCEGIEKADRRFRLIPEMFRFRCSLDQKERKRRKMARKGGRKNERKMIPSALLVHQKATGSRKEYWNGWGRRMESVGKGKRGWKGGWRGRIKSLRGRNVIFLWKGLFFCVGCWVGKRGGNV